jgi:hypothetical protein
VGRPPRPPPPPPAECGARNVVVLAIDRARHEPMIGRRVPPLDALRELVGTTGRKKQV